MIVRRGVKVKPKTHFPLCLFAATAWMFIAGFLAVGTLLSGCAQQRVREPAATEQLVPAARQSGIVAPKAGSPEEQAAAEAVERGDFESAVRIYSEIRDREPANGRVTYLLGFVYGQLGQRDLEVVLYEQAIGLGYANADVFYNLGIAYFETDRLDEAIVAFKNGLAEDSASADNRFGLGWVYQYQNRFPEAERELLRAVALEPGEPFFREKLAMLYEQTGELDKAAEQMEMILETDPEYPGAREYLEHLSNREQPREERPTGVGGD